MSEAEIARGRRAALQYVIRVARETAKNLDQRPFRRAHEGASLALRALADELEAECAAIPQPKNERSSAENPPKL